MKKYKNFLFVDFFEEEGVSIQDGHLVSSEGKRIPLLHKNYTLLGIVDECINAPYAEEFSAEIVEKDEFGGYLDYETEWNNYNSASDSFQTLARVLDLKPTDYILRDESK